MSKNFRKLVERNEHEGENWRFWLQVEGNEEALERLEKALTYAFADCDPEPFELTDEVLPEHNVDILIKYGNDDDGYMATHHKVVGTLTLPDGFDSLDWEGLSDILYKGEVKKLFRERV